MAERKEHLLGYLKTIDGKRFDDAVKVRLYFPFWSLTF